MSRRRDPAPIIGRLWPLLALWRGHGYGVGPGRVDCCTLTASVLRDAYGREVVTPDVWRDLCLSTASHRSRPWAPVESIADALELHAAIPGHGPERPEPGRLHLCQGWAHLTGLGIGAGSRGHAWFWLSFGGWSGVCIESSGVGPRVWDGGGRRHLDDVVSVTGELVATLAPMDWSERAGKWSDGVAFVALP